MASVLFLILIALLLFSWGYWLIAWSCLRAHVSAEGDPLPGLGAIDAVSAVGSADAGFDLPPVSVLKPLRGLDRDAYENFATFCRQDYGRYELVFGAEDAQDPACDVVRRLQQDFPERSIRLLVRPPTVGINPKSSLLDHLARAARTRILVISDSDIRVTPDYLRRVVSPLSDPEVGVVTCLYRTEPPRSWPAVFEALYLNTTFVPSAAVASRLSGVRYCFGASLALRRRDLEEAGGYAGIGDHLADDYEVGRRMTELGRRVVLSDYVVSQQLGGGSAVASWDRELRWARGLRASNPSVYPGMLLTYSTPLALLVLALSPWTIFGGWQLAAALLATTLLLRWFVAAAALRALGRPQPTRDLFWLPARDLLTGIVWICGLAGNHVAWRGRRYVLLPDGRLSRL